MEPSSLLSSDSSQSFRRTPHHQRSPGPHSGSFSSPFSSPHLCSRSISPSYMLRQSPFSASFPVGGRGLRSPIWNPVTLIFVLEQDQRLHTIVYVVSIKNGAFPAFESDQSSHLPSDGNLIASSRRLGLDSKLRLQFRATCVNRP